MAITDIYRVVATPQDIIKRALRLLGVVAAGEPLPADILDDGREALNDMLDAWNIEKLAIYVLSKNTFTLTGGQNPHTIGFAGELDAPRPARIEQGQAFITVGTSEVELEVINREQYAQISTASWQPAGLYYEPAMPLGNVYLNPTPDAAYTLILYLETLFAQIASDGTATEINLPPGYKSAIAYNLAVELAPEFSRSAPPEVIAKAVQYKTSLKRLNQRPLTLRVDPALLGSGSDSTAILTGGD